MDEMIDAEYIEVKLMYFIKKDLKWIEEVCVICNAIKLIYES